MSDILPARDKSAETDETIPRTKPTRALPPANLRVPEPTIPLLPASAPRQLGGPHPANVTVSQHILGIEQVASEDQGNVCDLMFFALTVKCQDGQFTAPTATFDRAGWWRVEIDTDKSGYWLLLGKWRTGLELGELQKIWAFDPNSADARSIIGITVKMAQSNDDPNQRDLTLAIHYQAEAARRRRLAQMANVSALGGAAEMMPIESTNGNQRKKRGYIETFGNWLLHGSAQ